MTKIDEGFDRAVSTRWGKRIVIVCCVLALAFLIGKLSGAL